jgi:hypothetical protein
MFFPTDLLHVFSDGFDNSKEVNINNKIVWIINNVEPFGPPLAPFSRGIIAPQRYRPPRIIANDLFIF